MHYIIIFWCIARFHIDDEYHGWSDERSFIGRNIQLATTVVNKVQVFANMMPFFHGLFQFFFKSTNTKLSCWFIMHWNREIKLQGSENKLVCTPCGHKPYLNKTCKFYGDIFYFNKKCACYVIVVGIQLSVRLP